MTIAKDVEIAPFGEPRERVRTAYQVRSTLISSSVLALREHGHYERYVRELPKEWHERILFVPAGVWLPFEACEVHYGACERLGLSNDQVLSMGNAVCKHTHKTVLATLIRMATEAGATPFTVFARTPRVWARLFTGGAVGWFKLGPKDVRFQTVGIPLARNLYWRVGYRGLLTSLTEPFCTRMYVRELPQFCVGNELGFRFSWV